MPNLNDDLKKRITKKSDTTISIGVFAVWLLALIGGGFMERFDGAPAGIIAVIAGGVYAACIVIIERRIRFWINVSYNAGALASTAIAYRHSPNDLRELADIIEQEGK